jgi:hypothetical protein
MKKILVFLLIFTFPYNNLNKEKNDKSISKFLLENKMMPFHIFFTAFSLFELFDKYLPQNVCKNLYVLDISRIPRLVNILSISLSIIELVDINLFKFSSRSINKSYNNNYTIYFQ